MLFRSKLLGDQKPDKPKEGEPAPPIRPLFSVSDLQKLKFGEVIINRFRTGPFKTKLTPNFKTDWGKKYDPMSYTTRPSHEVKVFDLKGFVTKLKGEQAPTGMPGMMGGGMMPGMMGGMPMSSAPFIPGGLRPAATPANIDEYVKRLDEQIAKLEREQEEEERRQKEKLAQQNKTITEVQEIKDDIKEEIKDEVKQEVKNEIKQDIHNGINETKEDIQSQIADILDHRAPVASVTTEPTYEDIEKPKINIDVDSVVVNNNNEKNDDFFDDFFGSEDE